jgi:hypothetical protein
MRLMTAEEQAAERAAFDAAAEHCALRYPVTDKECAYEGWLLARGFKYSRASGVWYRDEANAPPYGMVVVGKVVPLHGDPIAFAELGTEIDERLARSFGADAKLYMRRAL